jgi:hypothetical protein
MISSQTNDDKMYIISVVRDIMAITGGAFNSGNAAKSWNLIMSGGEECLEHDLPDNPVELDGMGVAQVSML